MLLKTLKNYIIDFLVSLGQCFGSGNVVIKWEWHVFNWIVNHTFMFFCNWLCVMQLHIVYTIENSYIFLYESKCVDNAASHVSENGQILFRN